MKGGFMRVTRNLYNVFENGRSFPGRLQIPCCGSLSGFHQIKWMSSSCTLEEHRKLLQPYTGGKVELCKNNQTGIASIVLNHPAKKNALSGTMMIELGDVITELEHWSEGRGVVIYGVDNCFCSGGDLALMSELMKVQDGGPKMSAYMQGILTRLNNLPLISASLIEGNSLGGGSELMTATDFRIVSAGVSIGFVQSKLGLVTGWGGATRLVDLIGRQKALELLSSGRIMSSKDALSLGLIDSVMTDGEDFIEQGKSWLINHLPATPEMTKAVKSCIVQVSTEPDVSKSLEKERHIFASVWGGKLHEATMLKHKRK